MVSSVTIFDLADIPPDHITDLNIFGEFIADCSTFAGMIFEVDLSLYMIPASVVF
jgi:hypothetical protein